MDIILIDLGVCFGVNKFEFGDFSPSLQFLFFFFFFTLTHLSELAYKQSYFMFIFTHVNSTVVICLHFSSGKEVGIRVQVRPWYTTPGTTTAQKFLKSSHLFKLSVGLFCIKLFTNRFIPKPFIDTCTHEMLYSWTFLGKKRHLYYTCAPEHMYAWITALLYMHYTVMFNMECIQIKWKRKKGKI